MPDERQPKLPDAHQRLYLSCKRLVAEKGFAGAKTREIAKLAGSSESQLFKHFGGKEEILLALFKQGWQQISEKVAQVIEKESDPLVRLQKLMRTVSEVLLGDHELATIFLLEGRRIGKDGQVLLISDEFYKFLALVDRLLQDAQRQGYFHGFNIQALRSALFGAAEALLRDMLLARRIGFPANYTPEDTERTFSLLLSMVGRASAAKIKPVTTKLRGKQRTQA